MTYRRLDKVAAYEAAMKMIAEDTALLDLPFGAGHAAVYKMLRASTKLTGTEARQVAGKALRDALHARQVSAKALRVERGNRRVGAAMARRHQQVIEDDALLEESEHEHKRQCHKGDDHQ